MSSDSEIDFETELEIIQNDVFCLPEADWSHITDRLEDEALLECGNPLCLRKNDEVLPNVAHGGLIQQQSQCDIFNSGNAQNQSTPSREENHENTAPPGFMRLIIKNDEICMQHPDKHDTMVVKQPKQRRLKQIDENVFIVSSERRSVNSTRRRLTAADCSKQKRDVMNNAERLRRTEIADGFRVLSQIIPESDIGKGPVGQNNISKNRILDSARIYCSRLQSNFSKLDEKLQQERKRHRELTFILNSLKNNNNNNNQVINII